MNDMYRSQFRMPHALYEALKSASEHNHRSVNAELISRLESTFNKEDVIRQKLNLPKEIALAIAELEAAAASIQQQIDKLKTQG